MSVAIPSACAVLSVAEMTAADRAAERAGMASLALMEAAGAAVARLIQSRWTPRPVVVLCGPGNNGGDGFVVARLLAEAGWPVQMAGLTQAYKGGAAVNADRWSAIGSVVPLDPKILGCDPLVVDALFGAGLARGLSGAALDVVRRINQDRLTCIAVDLPSGVAGDTGEVLRGEGGTEGTAPRCAATVTFFRPKPGHLLYPGRDLCGEVTVADIGIPPSVLDAIAPRTALNGEGLWRLPALTWRDHKYRRGSAIVVGSAAMTGAARLAARGCRRIGAGLATLAVPPEAVTIYALSEPGALIQPIGDPADLDHLLADERRNGVLIGPGIGRGAQTCERTLQVLASKKAVVLDADALTSFADVPESLFAAIGHARVPVVMTPHEGEFERLFQSLSIPAPGGKLERARAAAAKSGAVVVLKGPDTVIAHPDGRAAITDNAPPWLATGGSGDVLAGFILGLLVQGMDAFAAACAAVWLHGAAATRVGRGLIAEDLPEALPKVLESLSLSR